MLCNAQKPCQGQQELTAANMGKSQVSSRKGLTTWIEELWVPLCADIPEGRSKEEAQYEAKDEARAIVAGVAVVADKVAVGAEPELRPVGLREAGGEGQGRLVLLRNAQLLD